MVRGVRFFYSHILPSLLTPFKPYRESVSPCHSSNGYLPLNYRQRLFLIHRNVRRAIFCVPSWMKRVHSLPLYPLMGSGIH